MLPQFLWQFSPAYVWEHHWGCTRSSLESSSLLALPYYLIRHFLVEMTQPYLWGPIRLTSQSMIWMKVKVSPHLENRINERSNTFADDAERHRTDFLIGTGFALSVAVLSAIYFVLNAGPLKQEHAILSLFYTSLWCLIQGLLASVVR